MFPKISIGQLCGFLYLFILLTSVLSKFMGGDPLDPENVSNSLGAVAEGNKRFRISAVLDLISHASIFALVGGLYLAYSPYDRSLALLGSLWRIVEGVILTFNEGSNVVLLAVAQKFVSATGTETVALETVGLVAISFMPIMLFEFIFGAWLLFRGGQIGLL
jgi:hypothetical protein